MTKQELEHFKSPQGFCEFVCDTFDKLKAQFIEKNKQYGDIDPLANFRLGAALDRGEASTEAMYETAKSYELKHVAHIYGHAVNGSKVDESLKDVAVYSVIKLYLRELYYLEKLAEMEAEESGSNG